MEIERKFRVDSLPDGLEQYPKKQIEQAYLCIQPVVRVRRCGDACILTCKGEGQLCREEFELPLTEEAYLQLRSKAEGNRITKTRFYIPYGRYTIECDVFEPPLAPLVVAEVEFASREEAFAFLPPDWFGEEVTYDPAYTNAAMSRFGRPHGAADGQEEEEIRM